MDFLYVLEISLLTGTPCFFVFFINSILIMIFAKKIIDGETFCTYSASTIVSLTDHLDPVL
jgi:hypothetical protein